VATGWEVRPVPIDGRVHAVASSELGWVAVGNASDFTTGIWLSVDGGAWQPVEALPSAQGGVYGIVAGGPGFVAFGNDATIDFGKPFIWSSADGRTWAPASDATLNEYGGLASMVALDGVLFGAGGVATPGTDAGYAALWRSADGVEWTRIGLEGGSTSAATVVEFAGRLLAVGGSQIPLGGRVWSSMDGLDWSVVAVTGLEFAYVRDAIIIDGGLLAVGALGDDRDGTARPAVWQSANGVDWQMTYLGPCCESVLWDVASDSTSIISTTNRIVYSSTGGGSWMAEGTIPGASGPIWLTSLVELPGLGLVAIGDDGGTPVLVIPPKSTAAGESIGAGQPSRRVALVTRWG
jgi:hypothetical protein